jgi:hypothetical protein
MFVGVRDGADCGFVVCEKDEGSGVRARARVASFTRVLRSSQLLAQSSLV